MIVADFRIYKKDGSFLPFYNIFFNLSLEMSDEPFIYICISTLYLPMQKFLKMLFSVSWLEIAPPVMSARSEITE